MALIWSCICLGVNVSTAWAVARRASHSKLPSSAMEPPIDELCCTKRQGRIASIHGHGHVHGHVHVHVHVHVHGQWEGKRREEERTDIHSPSLPTAAGFDYSGAVHLQTSDATISGCKAAGTAIDSSRILADRPYSY